MIKDFTLMNSLLIYFNHENIKKFKNLKIYIFLNRLKFKVSIIHNLYKIEK
jgi:hypothetical protein